MKKIFYSAMSIFLSVLMLCTSMSAVAYATDNDKNDVPVIFVDGIASTDVINTETGESVLPPSASAIISGVSQAVLPLIASLTLNNNSLLDTPVSNALKTIFEGSACDENGDPIYPTNSVFEWPTEEEILAKYTEESGYTSSDPIVFSYDWRLDMVSISSQLHEFIEYVLDVTGADKVNLIGFSMGTCVVMTYMHDYDYEYVNNVVLLAGAYNGVSTCGEPFSGKIAFSDEALVRYIYTMLGEDFSDNLIKGIIDAVYQSGLVDNILDFAADLTYEILDDIYETAFKETFARMAGFWSLIPYDLYDEAKDLIIGDNVSDIYVAKIDYYHYEIQGNNAEIIDTARDLGINVSIVAKYGSTVPPCIESINEIGDSVIDTKFESFGATCSLANTTLGNDYVQAIDDGHNHISADNLIDASTCQYPENTWFIKGLNHAEHNDSEWELCDFLLNSEEQPTVWDNENYPQFMTLVDDKFVPMTSENATNVYAQVTEVEDTYYEKFLHTIKTLTASITGIDLESIHTSDETEEETTTEIEKPRPTTANTNTSSETTTDSQINITISDMGIIDTDNNIIIINTEMTAEECMSIIVSEDIETIKILDSDGNELALESPVCTGYTIQALDENGEVMKEYVTSILMDVDGNGKVTASDARLALRCAAKLDALEGVYAIAADADSDGTIEPSDARVILRNAADLE